MNIKQKMAKFVDADENHQSKAATWISNEPKQIAKITISMIFWSVEKSRKFSSIVPIDRIDKTWKWTEISSYTLQLSGNESDEKKSILNPHTNAINIKGKLLHNKRKTFMLASYEYWIHYVNKFRIISIVHCPNGGNFV